MSRLSNLIVVLAFLLHAQLLDPPNLFAQDSQLEDHTPGKTEGEFRPKELVPERANLCPKQDAKELLEMVRMAERELGGPSHPKSVESAEKIRKIFQGQHWEIPAELDGKEFSLVDDRKELEASFVEYPTSKEWYSLKSIYLPVDQSDWEIFENLESENAQITKIRLFGFPSFGAEPVPSFGDKGVDASRFVDVTTFEQTILHNFEIGLNKERMFRPLVSDVGRNFGAFGFGSWIGVISVKYDKRDEPLIIGVTVGGFMLGKAYGSERHSFYSPTLAKVVALSLEETAKRTLSEDSIAALSGTKYLQIPRDLVNGGEGAEKRDKSK